MLLKDYIKQCLKNPEFRKYWEEDFPDYSVEEMDDSLNDNPDAIKENVGDMIDRYKVTMQKHFDKIDKRKELN